MMTDEEWNIKLMLLKMEDSSEKRFAMLVELSNILRTEFAEIGCYFPEHVDKVRRTLFGQS